MSRECLSQGGGRSDRIPGGDGRTAIDATQCGGIIAVNEDAIADFVQPPEAESDRAIER